MTKFLIKTANAIDVHVGSRLRMRRMMIGMSQEKLGKAPEAVVGSPLAGIRVGA